MRKIDQKRRKKKSESATLGEDNLNLKVIHVWISKL